MRIRISPIPPGLVERAAALDARCDLDVQRCTEWPDVGANKRVTWTRIEPSEPALRAQGRRACYVRIALRVGRTGAVSDYIDVSARTCAEALEQAIAAAEARGWHKPR